MTAMKFSLLVYTSKISLGGLFSFFTISNFMKLSYKASRGAGCL